MTFAPGLELHAAALTALSGNAALLALLPAAKIFDEVPDNADFPYAQIGAAQEIGDDFDCLEGVVVAFDVTVYARGNATDRGSIEARRIAAAVRAALHDKDLTLSASRLVSIEWRTTRTNRQPDPKVTQCVVSFEATIEKQEN